MRGVVSSRVVSLRRSVKGVAPRVRILLSALCGLVIADVDCTAVNNGRPLTWGGASVGSRLRQASWGAGRARPPYASATFQHRLEVRGGRLMTLSIAAVAFCCSSLPPGASQGRGPCRRGVRATHERTVAWLRPYPSWVLPGDLSASPSLPRRSIENRRD